MSDIITDNRLKLTSLGVDESDFLSEDIEIEYNQENYRNLEAVLQKKKFPVSFNIEDMNRLKKELKFESEY